MPWKKLRSVSRMGCVFYYFDFLYCPHLKLINIQRDDFSRPLFGSHADLSESSRLWYHRIADSPMWSGLYKWFGIIDERKCAHPSGYKFYFPIPTCHIYNMYSLHLGISNCTSKKQLVSQHSLILPLPLFKIQSILLLPSHSYRMSWEQSDFGQTPFIVLFTSWILSHHMQGLCKCSHSYQNQDI